MSFYWTLTKCQEYAIRQWRNSRNNPRFLITAFKRLGIDCTRDLHNAGLTSSDQMRDTSWRRWGMEVIFHLHLIMFQMFSMRFISGEFPGHGSMWKVCCSIQVFTTLAVWHGAESCWNQLQWWRWRHRGRFSCRSWRYLTPVIISPVGRNTSAPGPWALKHPHTMTWGACFTVLMVYFGA